MKQKISIAVGLILCLLFFTFFLSLFINCIENYHSFDIAYDDLSSEKRTFLSFEKRRTGKGGYSYNLFFEEYADPFHISSTTTDRLDENVLNGLKQYDTIHVYYQTIDKFHPCELTCDTTMLLKLFDYVEVNQDNQILGMIVTPFFMIGILFVVLLLIRCLIAIHKNDLGKPWLEAIVSGHAIRVLKSSGIFPWK